MIFSRGAEAILKEFELCQLTQTIVCMKVLAEVRCVELKGTDIAD